MPKLSDLCHHVRSKNAGPFWITLDFFARDEDALASLSAAPPLADSALAGLLGTDPRFIKRFVVPNLLVLKISYPRPRAQGGVEERDMHGGQQFVRLLDAEV